MCEHEYALACPWARVCLRAGVCTCVRMCACVYAHVGRACVRASAGGWAYRTYVNVCAYGCVRACL